MRPFLLGFSDELMKVAFDTASPPSAGPKPRVSTAPPRPGAPGAPQYKPSPTNTPQPVNQVQAGKGYAAAIPTQRMDWKPPQPQATGWRPQKPHRPAPAPAPTPPKPKKSGGGGRRSSGPSFVPYQTADQYLRMSSRESGYNRKLKEQKENKKYFPQLKKEEQRIKETSTTSTSPVGARTRVPAERPVREDVAARTIPTPVRQRYRAAKQYAKPTEDIVKKIEQRRAKWLKERQQKDLDAASRGSYTTRTESGEEVPWA